MFDVFGRESLSSCREVLAPGGRFITTIPNGRQAVQAVASRLARLVTSGKGLSSHVVLARSDGAKLDRIAALMAEGRVRSILDSIYPLAEARAAHERSRTWRSRGKLVLRVKVSEVDWIESSRNNVLLHVGAAVHTLHETTASIERRLDPRKLLQVPRSTIVNIERIKDLQPWFNGEYVLTLRDGTELTMSSTYKEKLKEFRPGRA